MDPLSMAIGVGGSLLGGVSGALGASGQRAWEERMANTQYQRTVADMKAAGLNPMMMYARGASGPSAMPQLPPNAGAALGEGISSSAKMAAIDIPMSQSTMAAQQAKAASDRAGALAQTQAVNESQQRILQMGVDMALKQQQLEQVIHTMSLTDAQRAQVEQDIQNLQAQKLLVQKQTLLTGHNAAIAGTEAGAISLLTPMINSARDAFERMSGLHAPAQGTYPNEDIKSLVPSYVARTKGLAASAGQGVTPGGSNSAWQSIVDFAKSVLPQQTRAPEGRNPLKGLPVYPMSH